MNECHPVLQRLLHETGANWVNQDNLQAAIAGPHSVLFLGGDPVHYPEVIDVAAVLPELLRRLTPPLVLSVVSAAAEQAFAAQFGVHKRPALLFFRGGRYMTTLTGMYDWQSYQRHLRDALNVSEPVRSCAS